MNAVMSFFRPKELEITYTPGTFVKEFDGWRGVGISFVVLAHYFPSAFIGSWVFMEMFFVMSGFLITGILIDSKGRNNYYKRFMERRVLRVFPLYYLCLFILFFLLPHSWIDLSYYRQHQVWFWLYVENWLYAIDGWPHVKALHHFWSLAIEEQFYILWPLVVWIFSPKGLIRFCIILFFFSIIFRNTGMQLGFVMPFPYVATLGRMEGITLGAMIAVMVRSERLKAILERYTYSITVISGCIALLMFAVARSMKFQDPIHYTLNYTIVDIFFAGMITMTLCKDELPGLKKVLNRPLFKQLGIMSYCIYIFHYPIQGIVEYNFMDYFTRLMGSGNLAKLGCVSLAALITIPVVYLVHKKVELPLWKIKRKT
jgi:peptidoglycan/LPS O-acetylase OafA/YrhL